MIGSAASLIGSADSFSKRARMYLSVSARCAADIVPISAKTKVLRACVSARAASCSFSMGRSFPLMGAWGFHRIGLDWPAISNHPAHAGTHCHDHNQGGFLPVACGRFLRGGPSFHRDSFLGQLTTSPQQRAASRDGGFGDWAVQESGHEKNFGRSATGESTGYSVNSFYGGSHGTTCTSSPARAS